MRIYMHSSLHTKYDKREMNLKPILLLPFDTLQLFVDLRLKNCTTNWYANRENVQCKEMFPS